MKKLIAFCLFGLSLFGFQFIPKEDNKEIFSLSGISQACLVTTDNFESENSLTTLDYTYVYAGKDEAFELYKQINPKAVILFFQNLKPDDLMKSLNMLVLKEEYINDCKIIYGYTSKYNNFRLIENKRVNVQIACKNNEIIAGFPLILSGF